MLLASACKMKPLDPPVFTISTSLPETAVTTVPWDEPKDFQRALWRLWAPWAYDYLPKGEDTAWEDHLWTAYQEISQTYNVIVQLKKISGLESVLPKLAAGEVPDVLGLSASEIPLAAKNGFILPLDHVDLAVTGFNPADDRLWHQGLSEQMRWKGRQWSVQVASEVDLPCLGTLLVYNRDITAAAGVTQLENLVETGKWTRNYYRQLSNAVSRLPSDSLWVEAAETPFSILAMNGHLPVIQTSTGQWHTQFMDMQSVLLADFLRDMHRSKHFTGAFDEAVRQFTEGNIAILWISSHTLLSHPEILQTSFPTGVLPPPQTNDSTASFSLATGYKGYCITNNGQLEKTVAVFNAWAGRMNRSDWLEIYGNSLSLNKRQLNILKNHVSPYRIANGTEVEPGIARAIQTYYITRLLKSEGTTWNISIEANKSLSWALRPFNAE